MSNNTIMITPNEKKAIPILSKLGESKERELVEMLKGAYRPNPEKKDIQKLQKSKRNTMRVPPRGTL